VKTLFGASLIPSFVHKHNGSGRDKLLEGPAASEPVAETELMFSSVASARLQVVTRFLSLSRSIRCLPRTTDGPGP